MKINKSKNNKSRKYASSNNKKINKSKTIITSTKKTQNKTNRTIKKNKNKTKRIIKNNIKQLIKDKKLKDPNKLRIGYISRPINGSRYIVKYNSKKQKYFTKANKAEIECHTLLQQNMKKFISMYKSGHSPFKSIKNAMSFAIKETENTFPKCLTSKGKYNRKLENRSYYQAFLDYINYYKKYYYYKFF
jgi:hypothetical protein